MGRFTNLARRTPANLRAFVDGVTYTRSIQAPAGPNAVEAPKAGPLTTYFDGYTEGPGLWKWRHYFPIYERHFSRFVGREVYVLEVGVFSGGSLDMWRQYFGPKSTIYGVDIEPACVKYEREQVRVFIGDQADPKFWDEFLRQVSRIDVLIDDGGHEPRHQITTLKAVLPAISPGGVYLCEDSQGGTHAFHGFVDGLGRKLHSLDMDSRPSAFQQHVASIHRYPFITVIEKPTLPVPRFESQGHGSTWEPFIGVDDVPSASASS
jgi:hypothetical protein